VTVYTTTSIHELVGILSEKALTCFCCKWILEDLQINRKLTGHPKDSLGGPVYPVDGKRKHLQLEGILCDTLTLQ
jgi:hypothetical protein